MSETQRKMGRWVLFLLLLSGSLTMTLPFLLSVAMSLQDPGVSTADPAAVIPRDASSPTFRFQLHWENHAEVWRRAPLGHYYVVSLVVAVLVTVGRIVTSCLAAYAFARLEFPGRNLLFLLYMATLMVPTEVTMIPSFILISELGWMNSYAALILPGIFTAFGTFMLRQFFLTIPKSLEEAALIDGCSRLGILWRVIVPLSAPALATLALLSFLGSWNEFLWPLLVTHTKDMFTIPVGLAQMQGDYKSEVTVTLAASVQVLLPTFVLFVFCQRRITAGIATTGLGGT